MSNEFIGLTLVCQRSKYVDCPESKVDLVTARCSMTCTYAASLEQRGQIFLRKKSPNLFRNGGPRVAKHADACEHSNFGQKPSSKNT